jgi:uncharacterized membrane protein YhiD involved in acid resistance
MMPSVVLNDCSMDLPNVDGLDDTLPPVETGAAAPCVLVGFGVTAFVGAGFGVFVGNGVAVGTGVFVGRGVTVGAGVFVGAGVGVLVGSDVAVGGIGVEVGGLVGMVVGVDTAVGLAQAARDVTITTISNNHRRESVNKLLLVRSDVIVCKRSIAPARSAHRSK